MNLFLRSLVAGMTVWFFLWGTCTLILRLSIGMPAGLLNIGWIVAGLIAGAAFLRAYLRRPAPKQIRALLDAHNNCGGLLMAEEENEIGEWSNNIPPLHSPVAKWRNKRKLVLLSISLLFAAISVTVPERELQAYTTRRLETNRIMQEMQAKVDMLKEVQILHEAQANDIEQRLSEVGEDSDAGNPIETWEALDTISRELEQKTDQALEKIAAGAKDVSLSADLSQLLDKAMDEDIGLQNEEVDKLMNNLAQLLDKQTLKELADMLGDDGELSDKLPFERLSAEQLKKLAEMLGDMEGDMLKSLKKLAEAKMIDPSKLASCSSCTNAAAAELARMIAESCGDSSSSNMAAVCAQLGLPGRGSISRGRGDAPMTWQDPTSETNAEFKEETIESAALVNIKRSRKIGESIAAPEISDSASPSTSGVLSRGNPKPGSAHKNIVFPEHKGTVRRYFERED